MIIYNRAAHLRECIESLLRKQDAGYPVRFDNGKNTTEFGYSWEIIIAEN